MKLDNFRLLVNDFSASFHFWHDIVGLNLIYKDDAGEVYAYFQAGDVRLELLKADYFASSIGSTPTGAAQEGYRGAVVFKVDDVDATYADLAARGAPTLAPPQDRPQWHCRTAHLLAPDGYVIELFKSLAPPPWDTEPANQ